MSQTDDFYKNLLDNLTDGVYFVDRERRITYWNKGAERLTGFGAADVVGSHCWDNILMHVDAEGCQLCDGPCPLAATMENGCSQEAEVFLHHKEGHRVPVSVRASPIYDTEGKVVGAVETFNDNSAKAAAVERAAELEELALLDPVTGVGNRRYAEVRLRSSLEALERYGWPFGVLFFDVDHFKLVNDEHGHETGDRVLRMVACTLAGNLRMVDAFGRWGGEEFVAVIANTTGENLMRVAERCRRMVAQSLLEADGKKVMVTVSAGAALAQAGDTVSSLVERADRMVYRAKSAGRNRVELDELAQGNPE